MAKFPVINLNGTDGVDLFKEVYAAVEATRAANWAVQRMTVHGRDYQTVDVQHYQVARAEHNTRLTKLIEVQEELEQVMVGIYDQLSDADKAKARA